MFFKKKDSSKQFWKWFTNHKSDLEIFLRGKSNNHFVHGELSQRLKKIHDSIVPEVGLVGDNYSLTISCNGQEKGIPHVERLIDTAPEIEQWVVRKFRKPKNEVSLRFAGLSFELSDIGVKYHFNQDNDTINITIMIRGYDPSDIRYQQLGFLYLQHALGEFNFMTRISSVVFDRAEDITNLISLIELRDLVEGNWD